MAAGYLEAFVEAHTPEIFSEEQLREHRQVRHNRMMLPSCRTVIRPTCSPSSVLFYSVSSRSCRVLPWLRAPRFAHISLALTIASASSTLRI